MAKDPLDSDIKKPYENLSTEDQTVLAQNEASPAGSGGQNGSTSVRPNAEDVIQAADDCAVTDQQTILRVPVLDNDPQGDQAPEIIALSQPESGTASIADDGSIRFSPDEAGLQEIRYVVEDGAGGTADAKANIFVNPENGQVERSVLAGLNRDELVDVARSCADGMALDVARLAGDQIVVEPPEPGQRIQIAASPGQTISIQDPTFLEPELLRVDGGLLVIAEDGRMIFLENFVAAAENDTPVTLSIADKGPFDGGTILLASVDTTDSVDGRVTQFAGATEASPNPFEQEPAAGPDGVAHGGGAGFSPYQSSSIGTGLDAIGPLGPTDLNFGIQERVLANAGQSDTLSSLGDGGIEGIDPTIPGDPNDPDDPTAIANQPPVISINANITVEVGEVTVGGPILIDADPLPDLVEQKSIANAEINGVDGRNLVVGGGGDAAIIFRDEVALFQNSVGVYLIGENGEILDPKLAFAAVEHSDVFLDDNGVQQHPFIRPGGGPLSPGDQVLLSELYPDQALPPGTKFGLFLVVDGGNKGELDGTEALTFQNTDGDLATIFDDQPPVLVVDGNVINRDVFHAIDTDPSNGSLNPLNPGGGGQTISGLVSDGAGLTVAFEDIQLGHGDDDFNDTVVDVLPIPETVSSLTFVNLDIAVDATIVDVDDTNLIKAEVELTTGGQAGDVLAIKASLEGTGITLTEDSTPSHLVLQGSASVEAYQDILRSMEFQFGEGEGQREISFHVVDAAGNSSNTEVVTLSPSNLSAELGTEGNDTLIGQNGVDNAISGRSGDDDLTGGDGNDIIDGGLGNDILNGGPGDDILIGGPGPDEIDGGPGADQLRYFSITERGDRIEGFNASEGDVLNFSDLLGNDSGTDNVEDLLRFDQIGNDIEVSVDVDGTGSDASFVPYVTLVDPVGITTVEEAVNSGTVIT